MLNYDKVETGTFKLEIGRVDILSVLRKTVSSFDMQVKKRGVDLELALAECEEVMYELTILGDDQRLRQVLRNLISNALKFCAGRIQVSAEVVSDGLPHASTLTKEGDGAVVLSENLCFLPRAGSIRISVTDDGVGMTREQTQQLFQEGVQFDVNRLQAGGGSGLGLYISKALVEQHGGVISVSSKGINLGSTFVVELPLYQFSPTDVESSIPSSTPNAQLQRCRSMLPQIMPAVPMTRQ